MMVKRRDWNAGTVCFVFARENETNRPCVPINLHRVNELLCPIAYAGAVLCESDANL